MDSGELPFRLLFEKFDIEIESRRQTLTGSFFQNHIEYSKAFGGLKAIETLRDQFTEIAEKAQNEEE